ncbi:MULTISPECIES: hypothetical protein [Acinetobacter]|uniref:DUF3298 domain-containing protein n=1 Tax=Acinetobacter piscicola TaxID=2006115 RepID=A0A7S6VYK1_9GAMM|nr:MULTISPECIES: hypothetical protein [Acinetobacter]QOW47279.1 hypothetical protein G0028_16100 [Acinetobacter piscicola]
MYIHKRFMLMLCLGIFLSACDSNKKSSPQEESRDATVQEKVVEKAEVLPYLNIQETKADYAVPFCEKKNCIEIDIQTLKTQDPWLNTWIANNQAKVIQDQIGLKQSMTLQQAVNAYVKKSDAWQDEFSKNKAYELHLSTRMASQRNQYVLLQLSVDTQQAEVTVKARQYFFVADRKTQKSLSILDVIQSKQQNKLNAWVQEKYQAWLKKQDSLVQKSAPKKLYWGQSDWFFDGEGVGLHYRAGEIVEDAQQLDIYFSKQQTQEILQAPVFQYMF